MSDFRIDPDDVRERVQDLPKLPQAVEEIACALVDENLRLDDFAHKIAIDPAIVARILRAANSPFYGMSGSIDNVHDAVRLIGLRTIATLLTAASVLRATAPLKCEGFDFQCFWEHSLATAICAQEVAHAAGQSQSVAFTAGLVHDIGKLVLATYYPQECGAAMRLTVARDCEMHDAEVASLGIGHAEVGGWIAQHWNFAESVCEAIRHHHGPPEGAGLQVSAVDVVHAADGIVHALDLVRDKAETVPRLQLSSWERLHLDAVRFEDLARRTEDGYAAICHALM